MKLHDYEIEQEVINLLLDSEELKALIEDKIFPVYIDKGTPGDAVYYDSELTEPVTCKMGNVTNTMHFYVCAVSSAMDNSNRIIGIIQDILEGEFNNPWMHIQAVGTIKERSDSKNAKTMDFLIEW